MTEVHNGSDKVLCENSEHPDLLISYEACGTVVHPVFTKLCTELLFQLVEVSIMQILHLLLAIHLRWGLSNLSEN